MEKPNDESQAQQDTGDELQDAETSSATADDTAAGDGSLQDWIDKAKRAHELVEAVDLAKVAQHDEIEVAKVASVGEALKELEAGHNVEHVEGVDEVLAQPDVEQQAVADLIKLIDDFGWADRIGRVLTIATDAGELKPLDLIPHREGLPKHLLCIAPQDAVGSGHFGLFVSEQAIFAASIAEPVSKHHWHVSRSRPYDNDKELKTTLSQFSTNGFE